MIFSDRDFTKPFWGHIDISDSDFDWNKMMFLVDTHSKDDYHQIKEKFRLSLNNFHLRGSSPEFAQNIYQEMKETFWKNAITNIAFIGFGVKTVSYPLHKDKMDVFLFQALGDMKIRVEDEIRKFIPGDYVYIPRGTHHQILPEASRVTFSFGVERDPAPIEYLPSNI